MLKRRGQLGGGPPVWQIPEFSAPCPPAQEPSVFERITKDAICHGFIDSSNSHQGIFVILQNGFVTFRLIIDLEHFTWRLFLRDNEIDSQVAAFSEVPTILSPDNAAMLFSAINACGTCEGLTKFPLIVQDCRRKQTQQLLSRDKETTIGIISNNAIHNFHCKFVFVKTHCGDQVQHCPHCLDSKLQDRLRARECLLRKKWESDASGTDNTTASSRRSFVNLSKESAVARLRALSGQVKAKNTRINTLQTSVLQMQKSLDSESIPVTEDQHVMLKNAIEEDMIALKQLQETSPQKIFWEQQKKYLECKGPQGMRWHPLLIRWGISLFMKSPAVYRNINKSGFIKLPHGKTIQAYLKFTDSEPDLDPEVLSIIAKEFHINENHDSEEQDISVAIVWDEMKIKGGLAVSQGTGKLVGFVQTDKFSSAWDELSTIGDTTTHTEELASHIIVFMVRGLACKVNLPFLWFPCSGFDSTELYGAVWSATGALESIGLKVRAWICDGAAQNRKFFNLHQDPKIMQLGPLYYTVNHFAHDNLERVIYFVCDVPHLVKTARNNLENSHGNLKSRNLMKNGKSISWSHIVSTVEEDMARQLSKLPRLKHEHIRLSPQLRMRVRLAAQVLSSSMSNAIHMRGKPEMAETANFCKMMDRWFDCLNGRYLDHGIKQRKSDLLPYRSVNDPRFDWLEGSFLTWLAEWENEIASLSDMTTTEKKKMMLSVQTSDGLKITTRSFIHLAKDLLSTGKVQFLFPEKLNQDRLEVLFSKLRRSLGDSDNPTVEEVRHRIIALLVSGRHIMAPQNANSVVSQEDDASFLPKRKKQKKK